ncbi:MAG TPA: hypothetical protein VGZ22_24735 [Isosphaeraceae bacterium]|jgi:hypothetical protein|nr:hypothetical protein [Isosphaeraceae bacterium]
MRRQTLWILCLGLAAAGCSGADNHPVTADEMQLTALSDVAELYRLYIAQNKKPPANVADFNSMEMMSPTGLHALKSGEVIVFLKADLPDLGEETGKGPGDVVLAYEKNVPQEGGKVLMLNRTVKTMTAEEFKSASKAGSTDSSASSKTR